MDQNNNIQKAKNVPPFVRYCSAIIPTMFDDSLSYYEALCALNNFLQTNVIDVINNNATVTESYIALTNELKEFVDTYFDNLDVQQEINNKLDDMAQDGTLQALLLPLVTDAKEQLYNEFKPVIDDIRDDTDDNTSAISTLSSRMDEFTNLAEGSTTGDAELADIRVGFDGTTYPNAGDAVRGQASFLNDAINDKNNYTRVKVLTQSTTTSYKNIFKPNHRYIIGAISYPLGSSYRTSGIIYSTPTYSSSEPTNVSLWNLDHPELTTIIEPASSYRSLRLWQPSSFSITYYVYDITYDNNTFFSSSVTDLPIVFKNGGLTDAGNTSDAAEDKVYTQWIPLKGVLMITFPDSIYCRCIEEAPNSSNGTKVITHYHPCSINSSVETTGVHNATTRVCFGYKDGTSLRNDDDILSQIKIRAIYNTSDYDVIVASSDSTIQNKGKADIVVDDSTATEVLASLFGCVHDIKALLLEGTYNINKFYTMEDGSKCALPLVGEGNLGSTDKTVRRCINIEGRTMTTPQQINNVKIVVTQGAHTSLDNSDSNYLIATPYVNDGTQVARSNVGVCLRNFNIIGWGYDKAITYIDLSKALSAELQSVNIRSWHLHPNLYDRFDNTPNEECVGIRVGRGSNYGIQNHVKNLNIWYCGKGLVCNGEHFIFEDVKTHHDYIGWYFGDRYTVGRMEHPNVMIGCSIESCYRFMVLSKAGVKEEQNYSSSIDGKEISRSTLVCIGLSTETVWLIPTNEIVGSVTQQRTLPILEVIKNCYRGRMEMDKYNATAVFENGSGNGFITTRYQNQYADIINGSNVRNI